MVQKKVAEKTPSAKHQGKVDTTPKTPPTLKIVMSGQTTPGPICKCSDDVFGAVAKDLLQADRETLMVLHLDSLGQIIAKEVISVGSLISASAHPREVFKGAVLNGSDSIVCVHNHPSGDPTPSREDREITGRLKEAGAILGIEVRDHIIIGNGFDARYYSFVDSGTMPVSIAMKNSQIEEKKNGQCKQELFDARDNLCSVIHKIRFVACMDWDSFRGNDDAQAGHDDILSEAACELRKIEEMISDAMSSN
jgi:hypothetical protein